MYQIFVVEDELLIRQNIRDIIENMTGPYAFCGEASDGEMALSMMQDLMPDILLTDIRMPFLDGFELIQHVKAMMPWLKIIIISGYDEFESAQKAISLGVDLYLLKPVRNTEMVNAIEKVAKKIEESKNKTALPAGYNKDELNYVLHQHFMQQVLHGGADTSHLLGRARVLDLDIIHPLYQLVIFYFDTRNIDYDAQYAKIISTLSDKSRYLYYFNGSDQLVLLLYASYMEELSEAVYRTINIVRHELKDLDSVITTVVGNVVERVSAVKYAYGTADSMLKRVHSVSAGKIIDINDTAQITAEIAGFDSLFTDEFQHKILGSVVEDVPDLLREYWNGSNAEQYNSMLYRYYTLVDVLKTAVQIVAYAKPGVDIKDIATQFSREYDIFGASSRRDSFETMAAKILQEAIRMKQENLAFIKHSHVIGKAEEYVAKNYCDPNITLISVAKHVGMSSAHFSTIFSQTMNKTFISYLTSMRIAKAKELLFQTDMKLSSIAMEIGYNEPNYFSHVFKKHEGITPKEFRSGCFRS